MLVSFEVTKPPLHHLPLSTFHYPLIHLEAKKSLGQNFLVDPKIHEKIVARIAPQSEDVVIEIGPGTGLLTRHLLASPLKRVIAFELDTRAIPELRQEFADQGERFQVFEQDFLTVNLQEIAEREGGTLRVAGNIPYYITSPILFKLIDERSAIQDATLLIQKEVSDRLTAAPGTKAYGIPTVLANFFGEVKPLFKVSAGSFRPVPKVDSALVSIDFSRGYFERSGIVRPEGFDESAFRKLVRGLFAMRRKTVRNNLRSMHSSDAMDRIERSALSNLLTLRAEVLEIPDFLNLTAIITEQ